MNKIKVTEDTLTKDELDLYKLCSKSGKKRFLVNKYNELLQKENDRWNGLTREQQATEIATRVAKEVTAEAKEMLGALMTPKTK